MNNVASIQQRVSVQRASIAKYLDRTLRGVTEVEAASFEESGHRLFTLETATIETLIQQSAIRAAAGEERCFPSAVSDGTKHIGGFDFYYDSAEERLVHDAPDGRLQIILQPQVFLADAIKLLADVNSLADVVEQIEPLKLIVGVPTSRMNAVGTCDPEGGRVSFYADQYGGLLTVGLETATATDSWPVKTRQIVVHQLAHAFERKSEVRSLTKTLKADLLRHAESGFTSSFGQIAETCANAINAGYLPKRLEKWKDLSNASPEDQACHMASEFWAELCAAKIVGASLSPEEHSGWSNLERVVAFIDSDLSSLDAGPLADSRNRGREREFAPTNIPTRPLRIDYVSDWLPTAGEANGPSKLR